MTPDYSHRPGGFDPECPCLHCVIVKRMILREAVASVALSRDPRAQTYTVDDPPDPRPGPPPADGGTP